MPEPSPYDTGSFSMEEILARLEAGRLDLHHTQDGSRLELRHAATPDPDRRNLPGDPPLGLERRRFTPLPLPTLFPEKGPILLLLVGGFATEHDLGQPVPFWRDDRRGGSLLWQALERAGLLARPDQGRALGQGGFWEDAPPRTHGLAMTYAGFQPTDLAVPFHHVAHRWNQHRLHTLVDGCWERSMDRLKVVALGESARFVMGAILHDLPGIPLLGLSSPTREDLEALSAGHPEAAEFWIEWAADLLAIGRS
ncbi:MAG TPA: hypothetical protein VF768_07710 [Holophagaceae bacterium]